MIELVREAGGKLLSLWPARNPNHELRIETKPDGSFVTEADYLSHKLLSEQLTRILPGSVVISEEGPRPAAAASAQLVWIVDPLDGTRLFIEGQDSFAVLVALCDRGRAEFGVMYFPARELMLVGSLDGGASENDRPLRVSDTRVFRSGSIRARGLDGVFGSYEFSQAEDTGFAVPKLCRGELDGLIVKTGRLGEWDIAATTAIVEASGGRVSDENGEPLRYNRDRISFGYFVASNAHLHDQIIAMIPR